MKNVTYISAGAGSGKTFRLTQILTELIATGQARPEEVILTTFTTKAAAEFKEKVKAALYERGLYSEATRLQSALIGTVHSVCAQMVQKYWFLIGLPPGMGVMTDDDQVYYRSQSLATLPLPEELNFLHEFCRQMNITQLQSSRLNYKFWQANLSSIIALATNYEISDFSESLRRSIGFISALHDPGTSADISDDEFDAMLREARTYVANSTRIKNRQSYYDAFDELRRGRSQHTVAWRVKVAKTMKPNYGATCEVVGERLKRIWHTDEVYSLCGRYITILFSLAERWQKQYADFKRVKNLMDFNDMEKHLRSLLLNDTARREIAADYSYLFVDEFQDSSPMQVKIFDSLADLMKHSWWVGDYKQSIYGFRGSDIALVRAVVDSIRQSRDDCHTETLDTSWRSLPEIVELCNHVFTRTFSPILSAADVELKPHRQNTDGTDCLQYFTPTDHSSTADQVAKLVADGTRPADIAVIARDNKTLNELARELYKNYHIHASRDSQAVAESLTWQLVKNLLHVVGNSRNVLSKANVAMLTEPGYSARRLIEDRLAQMDQYGSADEWRSHKGEFLADKTLIRCVAQLPAAIRNQSVGSLVESIAIELDLFDWARRVEPDPAFGADCLQVVITAAKAYEQHAIQMNLPASVEGFISYFETLSAAPGSGTAPDKKLKIIGYGDPDGVQLHTYHSCKGLQWKHVILMSLNHDPADPRRCVAQEMLGVHALHLAEPTADKPLPDVAIRLAPKIYGMAVPQSVAERVMAMDDYQAALKAMKEESNRLLYVGMTRARDVLCLDIEPPRKSQKLLAWPRAEGLDAMATAPTQQQGDAAPRQARCDLLGTGDLFADCTLTQDDCDLLRAATSVAELTRDNFVRAEMFHPAVQRRPRYLRPSSARGTSPMTAVHDFDRRITFGDKPGDMAIVGDCIHQIFATIEEPDGRSMMGPLIQAYGLTRVLVQQQDIADAWQRLADYLTEHYGPALRAIHERPFRYEHHGQTISGSMDLVWQTAEGDVLVDYKTSPLPKSTLLNPNSDHFVGHYGGQLSVYAGALEAAGEKVLARIIYYPVAGLLVELNVPVEPPKVPYPRMEFVVLGIKEPDFKAIAQSAVEHFGPLAEEVGLIDPPADDDDDADDDGKAAHRLDIMFHEVGGKAEANLSFAVGGFSAEGIMLQHFRARHEYMKIVLPETPSAGDITLLLAMLQALREAWPDCDIYFNGEADHDFAVSRDSYERLLDMSLANLRADLKHHSPSMIQGLAGIWHSILLPDTTHMSDEEIDALAPRVLDRFVEVQWRYANVGRAPYRTSEDFGENAPATYQNAYCGDPLFFTLSTFVVVNGTGHESKQLTMDDFRRQAIASGHADDIDGYQLVLHRMKPDEWQQFYDGLKGKMIHRKRVFLLRWNPAISSFRLDHLRTAHEQHGRQFGMNWSFYEHDQVEKGDLFVMLRSGDAGAGIVWSGVISSDIYEGDDWAGTTRKRYYADIEVEWSCGPDEDPVVPLAELEKLLPDINWQRGHSGQLLSDADAIRLADLWVKNAPPEALEQDGDDPSDDEPDDTAPNPADASSDSPQP